MKTGGTHSEETKKKMSEARKGEKHWAYGKKLSVEHVEKLKSSHLGQTAWNKGTKGKMPRPWNADKNVSRECETCFTRYKVPDCRKDSRFCSMKCLGISNAINNKGDKSPNWTGGSWLSTRKKVLIEQDYTCQMCLLREPDIMEVNHKLERADYPELARNKDNMEVLCPNCHRRKTNLFLKNRVNRNLAKLYV